MAWRDLTNRELAWCAFGIAFGFFLGASESEYVKLIYHLLYRDCLSFGWP